MAALSVFIKEPTVDWLELVLAAKHVVEATRCSSLFP